MSNNKPSVDIKHAKQKELVVEQLKKTPIVQVMCEKLGIGRSTFYRWRKDDPEFAKACDEALEDGCQLVNDLAESQLLSAIKDKNMTAIVFWLRTHHDKYRNKLEVNAKFQAVNESLNPEEEEMLRQALAMARSLPQSEQDTNNEA